MTPSRLTPPFDQIYQQYLRLNQAFTRGQISQKTYQAEIQKLVLTDWEGRAWWLDANGQWQLHNGTMWVPQEPPNIETASPPRKKQPPEKGNKKPKTWLWIVLSGGAVILCFCLVILFATGTLRPFFLQQSISELNTNNQNGLALTENLPTQTSTPILTENALVVNPIVTLSEQQQSVIDDFDWPDTFLIMEIDDIEGNQVRLETWSYYGGNTSFTFSNGVFMVDGETGAMPDGFSPTPYHPDQFPLGASLEQITAILSDYTILSVEGGEVIQPGVKFFTAQQLILGFLNNRLFYVEALAHLPEGEQ
jgi:hypothetical protein